MARLIAVLPLKLILVKGRIIKVVDLLFLPDVDVTEEKVITLAEALLNLQFDILITLACS